MKPIRASRPGAGFLFALSAVAIAVLTLPPSHGPTVPLDPLCIACGVVGGVDVVLNVVLFMPLGIALACLGGRPRRAIAAMLAASLAIELLQFVIPGRDPSLGDVLANSLGGALGFVSCAHADRLVRPPPRLAARLLAGWGVLWLVIQAVASYALVPAMPSGRYYGQIARDLGEMFQAFPGKVLNPTVEGIVVPNWSFAGDDLREFLDHPPPGGTHARATLRPDACPTRLAGIVRVADARNAELLILAQDGADLLFGVRTGAEVLRLRSVRYRLRDVFGSREQCVVQDSIVSVAATYSPDSVRLDASSDRGVHTARFTPNPAQGWRLFLPMDQALDGRPWDPWFSALWLAGLMLPFGYWGWGAARGQAPATLVVVGVIALALLTGLVALPFAIGAPPVGLWQCTAAAAGAITGAVAAAVARVKGAVPGSGVVGT